MDDNTLRMYLGVAFRPFLANLTLRPGQMASPTAVDAANSYADRNGDFGKRPVGTGPFILDEWVPDQRFVLSRNPNYWEEGLPYLDGIRVPIIGDKQIQFAMLRTGEIDIMEEMRPEDRPVIARNPDVKTVVHEGTSTWMLFFRLDEAAFRQSDGEERHFQGRGPQRLRRSGLRRRRRTGLLGPGPLDGRVVRCRVQSQRVRSRSGQAAACSGRVWRRPILQLPDEGQFPAIVGDPPDHVLETWASTSASASMRRPPTGGDFVSGKHDGPLVTFFSPRPDPHILLRRLYHTNGVYGNNVFKFDSPRGRRPDGRDRHHLRRWRSEDQVS